MLLRHNMSCVRCPAKDWKPLSLEFAGQSCCSCTQALIHDGGAWVCRVTLGFVVLLKTGSSVIQLLKQFSFLVSKKHKAALQKGVGRNFWPCVELI